MENTKILPENTIPVPSKTWKLVLLFLASLILQVLSWYMLRQTLFAGSQTLDWVLLAVVAAAGISLTAFFSLTNKSRLLAYLLIVCSAAGYFWLLPHDLYVWIGGAVFALFSIWYEYRLMHESASRVDFSITRVIGASSSILIYAILILVGFNIYYKSSADFRANPDDFYSRIGQQAAKSVPYLTDILPGNVDLNQPAGDYFASTAAANNPEFKNASSFEREVLIDEAKNEFENEFQVSASNNQSMADVISEVITGKVRDALAPYQAYLPIVFTVIIVGILYTFAFLLRWTILLISWILFGVLRAAGFFRLEKVQVEVEKLVI
ncbi:MAG TPA: hypothetical protein VFX17_02275 [Patescibacteria group bacterium]|nr:hypothetical protein [Patescibacteria group bacterium]